MPHPLTVVRAATATVGVEKGVIAFETLTTAGATFTLNTYRSAGAALEMLGVLQSLLGAVRAKAPGPVRVEAPAHLVEAYTAFRDSGTVLIADALHPLVALDRLVRSVSGDRDVELAAANWAPAGDQAAAFEARVAAERETELARAALAWQLPPADAAWVAGHGATVVYTDGSHMASTGFGAWAWWVDEDTCAAGTVAGHTSTFLERLAIAQALRDLAGPLLVVTDLEGVIPSGYGRVLTGEHARVLRELRTGLGRDDVRVLVVKGHDACVGNIAADRLASATLQTQWAALSSDPERARTAVDAARRNAAELRRLRVEEGLRYQARRDRLQADGLTT